MTVLKYWCEHEYTLDHGSVHSAGLDLHSPYNISLSYDEGTVLDLGLYVQIPEGYVGLVVPRSSLGRAGLSLDNTIGVIDSDYRGEVRLLIRNSDPQTLDIYEGQRIAQLIIVPYFMRKPQRVMFKENLSETDRGTGGFGSTG